MMRTNFLARSVGWVLGWGVCLLAGAALAVDGDASKGKTIAASVCANCHGADGNSIAPNFPRLAGQLPVYLVKQMQDFKKKKRSSEVMSPFIDPLSDSDVADLAVYFGAQKSAPGVVRDASQLAAGKEIYMNGVPDVGIPACTGCHGEDGGGSPPFPRISGQFSEYGLEQMKLFASGKRQNDKRLMQTVAQRLTEAQTVAVMEYVASLK